MTEFQNVSWERPLSAQLGGNPEVMRVEVATNSNMGEVAPSSPYVALESMPGVLDVDRDAGVVRTEEGTFSVARFLGRGTVRLTQENQD